MRAYFLWKKKIKEDIINIGTGVDYSIKDYAKKIIQHILPNQTIDILYDLRKPNGTPRKVLDISLAKKYGWRPSISLKEGIKKTYESYLKKLNNEF